MLQVPVDDHWSDSASGAGWLCRAAMVNEICAFAAAKGPELRAAIRLLDDRASALPSWRSAWREFSRGSNLLQFLPGAVWVTTEGVRDGLYGSLLDREAPEPKDELEDFLADVIDEGARVLVREARKAGCSLPEAGYELFDSSGEIFGMAELAWVEQKVLVLIDGQMEFRQLAEAAGWRVFAASCSASELVAALAGVNA
jgi:hypothetical protein